MDLFYVSGSPPGAYFAVEGTGNISKLAARLGQTPRYTRQAFWLADSQRGRFFTRESVDRTGVLRQALPDGTVLIEYTQSPSGADRSTCEPTS